MKALCVDDLKIFSLVAKLHKFVLAATQQFGCDGNKIRKTKKEEENKPRTSIDNVYGIVNLIFMQISSICTCGCKCTLILSYHVFFFLFQDTKEGRALFPRLEYTNEWTPVGRGDPLKDPTYDYMPPVLDRVRYWAEGTSNKNKNDILILGMPSKKITPANKKNTYGPIKRTYYSMPYQSHFSPPVHHQQQQQQQQSQQYVRNLIFFISVSFNFFSCSFSTAPAAFSSATTNARHTRFPSNDVNTSL